MERALGSYVKQPKIDDKVGDTNTLNISHSMNVMSDVYLQNIWFQLGAWTIDP